ncbi:MAG: bifunctional adenosylcobinamide kinase/adenosylcobinamide-phosphate guanylyltransferase [Silvanigrellales bacterium]|nr:bifunctional adenosylcobinamide kinase/adenosylcobinamide-phosphate guanylyltransferase [Silvanigrellales bacterium]
MTPLHANPQLPLAFLLGGAQSGKTRFAASVALECEKLFETREQASSVCFVGTARLDGDAGSELRSRIGGLRLERPPRWSTLEPSSETPDVLAVLENVLALSAEQRPRCVVFDCATLWLAWELSRDFSKYSAAQLSQHLEAQGVYLVRVATSLAEAGIVTIVVSSETGAGIVPGTVSGRLFRDALGLLNMRAAAASSLVLHMVAGLSLCLREGGPSLNDDAPVRRVGASTVAHSLLRPSASSSFSSSTPF